MFFPYKDDNPRIVVPFVTYAIIAFNLVVFFYQIGLDFAASQEFTLSFGLIPATFTDLPRSEIAIAYAQYLSEVTNSRIFLDVTPNSPYLTVFTSMFMHGGLAHIFGNMLFLWIFGDNVEGALGHVKFAVFYLLCGIGAAAGQIFIDVNSMVPMIGASGAISGVLAAYMLRYPRARIHTFVFLIVIFTTIKIPAFIVISIWFATQVLSGIGTLGVNTSGGVAWFAHIGGFITGVLLERFLKFVRLEKY
ncbi:MAG: rhomboid family intramembrane serine protease [Candidatus Marinimicrobia bacterium]|nr:rhomboid family intramembrane serine protease [Candidatus Neomarinimicrobiota bacterium]